MAIADKKYKELLQKVLDKGVWDTDGEVRPVYEDGAPAHSLSIFGEQVKFEPGELPIITSKHVPVKSSINEIVHAFFRLKTNKVEEFEELNIGYWKSWAMEDNTIGESYGAQLRDQKTTVWHKGMYKKLDQVDFVLHELKHNPYSRRIIFDYWRPESRHLKALEECARSGQFNVRNGQLDFTLIQRSVDTINGLPTNWTGYYALQSAIANVFGYKVGSFTHQMGNVHLYSNQLEAAREVINAPEYEQPELWVNPEIIDFYEYGVDDIKLVNYKHGDKIRSGLAI